MTADAVPTGPGIAAVPALMRAAVCHAYGPPESMTIDEIPVPEPGPGQVLVGVAAAAVNFPDVLLIANKYQVSVATPFVPGSEFAGLVVAVGAGVTAASVGDRVLGAAMNGAFAEYIVASADGLVPVPEGVDLRLAAAFWVAHSTAYHTLRSVADVQPGEWVVVLGAAGGVGLAAVEVARLLGARVIAAASNQEKLELCRARGAEGLVDYTTEDLRARIREITGGTADVVVDPVGGPAAEQALRALGWGSRFVTVGFASGEIPRIALNLVLLKGVTIKGFEMRTFGDRAPALVARDRAEMIEHLAAGRLVPHLSSTHPLTRVAEALAEVADRRALGKVLVVPGDL
jgi:NADPH2:quinone reductase